VDQTILADHGRLRQLLENLFRNAVDHGGEDVAITVGELEQGFYVADDGPGISPDNRDNVFESGYSTSEDGNGLGLQIVKQIVDGHDWDITVTESKEGGARFEITSVETTSSEGT
jgi:signal transduction histidine kinase